MRRSETTNSLGGFACQSLSEHIPHGDAWEMSIGCLSPFGFCSSVCPEHLAVLGVIQAFRLIVDLFCPAC